jgi:iron complex outermembrane receptor protein
LSISAFVLAAILRGIITTPAGQPVEGALVAAEGKQITSDAAGRFALDLPDGPHLLTISKNGFQTASVETSGDANVVLKPALAETIVVSGIRADAETPVTKSGLQRADIDRDYHGQDIPLLLRDTPSINAYAEAGVGGSGYSYITLRGISPTRLNFTLDGVPLADSEDMGTYFADFPDLARSLQSIQVQRGVGTSTVGSPSFGGSVNLESLAPSQAREVDATAGAGSFGARLGSVGWQSGELPGGFALYARLSASQSDGFREHSGMRGRNLFVSAAKQGESSQFRVTAFSAHEWTRQSFLAADQDTLRGDLRANPNLPSDRDSFGYDLGQVQYLRALGAATALTASLFYQRGYGWYTVGDSRYGLDGLLLGGMLTMNGVRGPLSLSAGLHLNQFRREHTRDTLGARDYFNYGTKGEANVFAKASYDRGRRHLYGDAQLRTTDFHYHGDVAIAPIRWTFFNPKLGMRYDLTAASSVYASAGLSTREPARNDLFQGEDNATFAHDLRAVRPERLVDLEGGWEWRGASATFAANLFAMEFRHEIASTGELSDIGLLLRRNVDRSYRRGVELEESWQVTPRVRLRGNAALSRGRIRAWTQFYDVYDAAGALAGSRPLLHRDVAPLLTPPLIVNQSLDFTVSPRLTLGATARYVARSYLDNTNNPAFVTPSFATLDADAAIALGNGARLRVVAGNVLNNRRVFPSGYSYLFMTPGNRIGGIAYYYPQATRNAVVMVDVKR